ncbi:penicillin acylase family protein [Glaciecola siphonariae]|uniref:Penicillin acylase family protein n=1 Tax=Glaciecola siphonariae TaxID=521012 RepID=A0ABV9LSP4_9ALTE
MRMLKISVLSILGLALLTVLAMYLYLASSLPDLDGQKHSAHLSAPASIERDSLGMAVINAQSQEDASFLLGYAHAQDRLFQMDLLRKSAAGELSSIVGKAALARDKRARFFQFKQRARIIADALPEHEKTLLEQYAKGVNTYIDEYGSPGFEFALTGTSMQPWSPADTILTTFSMYIDLQSSQVERDFENTAIRHAFGQQMLDFMYQPSAFQAAIDLSIEEAPRADIPILEPRVYSQDENAKDENAKLENDSYASDDLSLPSQEELQDIGSNNWAVAGSLTDSASAMLSSDMHLGLNVPIIWYKAQLNYRHQAKDVSVSGVSLPGTPLVIAGSNTHIAWGFTNSNVDNVDWVELPSDEKTETVIERIAVKDGEDEQLSIEVSKYGPVRTLAGKKYALSWVALQRYAVNMQIADMPLQTSTEEALALAKSVAIPVQNMVVADANGDIAWQLTGAITSRTTPSLAAIEAPQYDSAWQVQDVKPAFVYQPEIARVWSANARVISTKDLERYGDGGYALGARQRQIADALLEKNQFNEQDFNQLQLDNRALFLMPWHNLLTRTLAEQPQKYAKDIELLNKWQACACADSIGYTLVRRFRSTVINELMRPIKNELQRYGVPLRHSMRLIETPVWQIIKERPSAWLPTDQNNYTDFLLDAYQSTKSRLIERYDANPDTLAGLEWGTVNALTITHPFASALGPLDSVLNMDVVPSFGDSFMPAVQGRSFGASQRLIVRPGNLDKAILTIPGGQSMHPLSKYYRAGFDEYAEGGLTPLLPQEIEHSLSFSPTK